MSREIKFRVWDNENKSYNDPYSYAYYAMTQDGGLDFYCHGDCMGEADPDVYFIEQYTGLTDKNGIEIYEGDIVEEDIEVGDDDIDGEYRYQVVWDEETLCWSLSPNYGAIHKDLWETNLSREVIGNVHENKELLDGSN